MKRLSKKLTTYAVLFLLLLAFGCGSVHTSVGVGMSTKNGWLNVSTDGISGGVGFGMGW